jgi:16S rRNA G527 N7-methylase RsmG
MMTKVMWFSGRDMTEDQLVALVNRLGEDNVRIVDETIQTAFGLSDDVEDVSVRAIISPINLWELFLKLPKDKPVIVAQSRVAYVNNNDGNSEPDVDDYFNLKWLETFQED